MGDNIVNIRLDNKDITLIGTAHVSSASAQEVRDVIEEVMPDSICIELDKDRYEAIKNQKQWRNTDIIKVIKDKQSTLLLVNLILSSYQKRLASQLGVNPGEEMLCAIKECEKTGANLVLADRNIKTTFQRIFRKLSLKEKFDLIVNLIMSIGEDEEITEETLEELKGKDMIQAAMEEISVSFPGLKKYLVTERDIYLSQKIRKARGEKIVAVVGAAHLEGIQRYIHEDISLEEISCVPKKSSAWKIIGWAIPLLIVVMIAATLISNFSSGLNQMGTWILWNSSLSAIGTLLAGGHILSILTAAASAPITSLNPLLAAGWFAGLTESWIRKPKVEDFESLSEDLQSLKGLWRNKITRILMVVIFTNLGSVLGTYLAGVGIFRIFFDTFF